MRACRISSVQPLLTWRIFRRLITTLVTLDAWWAYSLGTPPLIRTQSIWLEMPCSSELFQCPSAKLWKRLVDGGAAIVTTPVSMQAYPPQARLVTAQHHSPVGMVGQLSIAWIKILELHSKFPPKHTPYDRSEHDLVPWTLYCADDSGKMLGDMLGEIYVKNSRYLKHKNPNCVTLWHFLHLHLLANVGIFELAAGRNGAESARPALQDIATWTQTYHARRACLHAAGVYTAMSRRRINDGTMFHSEPALFVAALVLGLYVFMMHPTADSDDHGAYLDSDQREDGGGRGGTGLDTEPYEILDDVDWLTLGQEGLGVPPASTHTNVMQPENAAQRFLKHGGTISFSGTICEGGYNAAKMVLLDFANLLEEVGKWNAKGFCHIMRIMSDSLLDMDEG
jgi:hypothetical protein